MRGHVLCALMICALLASTSSAAPRRPPPLGWSTWQTCADASCIHDVCTEGEIIQVARSMKDVGFFDLGYDYIILDDCWVAGNRTAQNELTWDDERFPSGMDTLAKTLHDLGFRFGLYTSAGGTTCSGKPGSRGFYQTDANTFARWEIDYVKLDWCGDIKDEIWNGAKAHRDFHNAMVRAYDGKRDFFLEVVAGYLFLGKEIGTVADSFRFCVDHHDNWKSTHDQILCRADLVSDVVSSTAAWPSMDFLTTGGSGCVNGTHCPGQTPGEYRIEFAIWSLTQSPLIFDTDPRNVTDSMRDLLLESTALLELHQNLSTPPGAKLSTWVCAEPLACSVWGRQFATNEWIVALVNVGSRAHNVSAEFSTMGNWTSETSAVVEALWNSCGLGNFSAQGDFAFRVEPHDACLFRVRAHHRAGTRWGSGPY